jgi:uncharacterized protein YkwD
MLRCARTRRFAAASSILLGGVVISVVPATAAATLVPPVALPALPGVAPPVPAAPTAVAASGCRGANSRPGRASSARLRRATLCLINRVRASAGRGRFRAERHLARAAGRHASDMGRRNYFSHVSLSGKSPRSRARAAGWRRGVGEIIAWGCGRLATPRATVQAWLNSPPHRAIMLGGGHWAGVGFKRTGGCGGRAFWVVDVG